MADWVIVDWRPFQLPEVYGRFYTEEVAAQYAKKLFPNIGAEEGILVTQICWPGFDIDQEVFSDG